jgi:predicted O-methyltransferase YrrM
MNRISLPVDLGKKEWLLSLMVGISLIAIALLIGLASGEWTAAGSITFGAGVFWLTLLTLFVFRRLQSEIRAEANHIEATIAVTSILKPRRPLPPFGGAALEADTVRELVALLFQTRPGLIVECGSGLSTLITAYVLEQLGQGHIVSLEQGESWHHVTKGYLDQHGLASYADVVYAPLKRLDGPVLGQFQWYDPTCLAQYHDIDLLIVDGPTAWADPEARYPAVPFLWEKLSNHAVIFVDDTKRQGESRIVERWLAQYPGQLRVETRETSKGLALLRVSK